MPSTNALIGKIFIQGKIEVLTGLHIGGPKTSLNIGGVDLQVIKTAKDDMPMIPGSSLKGKLRSLLARSVGSMGVSPKDVSKGQLCDLGYTHAEQANKLAEVRFDDNYPRPFIAEIFGFPADSQKGANTPTRLVVRDAFLNKSDFEQAFEYSTLDEEIYTEEKVENTIDRKTGKADNIRQLERVPAGASFDFCMIYNEYRDRKSVV